MSGDPDDLAARRGEPLLLNPDPDALARRTLLGVDYEPTDEDWAEFQWIFDADIKAGERDPKIGPVEPLYREYESGSCPLCHCEPAQPGYRWMRWTEKVLIEGEAAPRRLRRSKKKLCTWMECPNWTPGVGE